MRCTHSTNYIVTLVTVDNKQSTGDARQSLKKPHFVNVSHDTAPGNTAVHRPVTKACGTLTQRRRTRRCGSVVTSVGPGRAGRAAGRGRDTEIGGDPNQPNIAEPTSLVLPFCCRLLHSLSRIRKLHSPIFQCNITISFSNCLSSHLIPSHLCYDQVKALVHILRSY